MAYAGEDVTWEAVRRGDAQGEIGGGDGTEGVGCYSVIVRETVSSSSLILGFADCIMLTHGLFFTLSLYMLYLYYSSQSRTLRPIYLPMDSVIKSERML